MCDGACVEQATGGIIPAVYFFFVFSLSLSSNRADLVLVSLVQEEFEILMQALEIGVKKEGGSSPTKKTTKGVIDPNQKNTLDGFFGIKPKKEKVEEGEKK